MLGAGFRQLFGLLMGAGVMGLFARPIVSEFIGFAVNGSAGPDASQTYVIKGTQAFLEWAPLVCLAAGALGFLAAAIVEARP
jgi:hypothetical protein